METLELMETISCNSTIDVEPSLYHSNISTLLQAVEEVEEGKTTMILSHNPGSEILVHQLSNRLEMMPTAAAALFEKQQEGWILIDVLRPKNCWKIRIDYEGKVEGRTATNVYRLQKTESMLEIWLSFQANLSDKIHQ